jgi:hypothetical protein
MRVNAFVVVGVLWVGLFAILAWRDVGTLYCETPYVLEFEIVPLVVLVTGFPFVIGYLAGRRYQ